MCDCCDGTDEQSCSNVCEQEMKIAKEEALQRYERVKKGHEVRQSSLKSASAMQDSLKANLEHLEEERSQLMALNEKVSRIREYEEKREREAQVLEARSVQHRVAIGECADHQECSQDVGAMESLRVESQVEPLNMEQLLKAPVFLSDGSRVELEQFMTIKMGEMKRYAL